MKRLAQLLPLSLLAALLTPAHPAAASFIYQSQSGSVTAAGGAPATGSSSQSIPFSGLVDIDEQASVQDSAGPDAYYASASLETQLDPNQISISGSTYAEVGPCDPASPDGFPCNANANANVSILFDLAGPASLQLEMGPSDFFGRPSFSLTNLDLGFSVEYVLGLFETYAWQCGALSQAECDQLAVSIITGGEEAAPAGHYQLDFALSSFDEGSGHCAGGGCPSAGGSIVLTVVPEPGPGILLGAGLAALGVRRRGRP